MSDVSQINVSLPRRGMLERVDGSCRFGVDLAQPGDLHLFALRAGTGPARIKRLDLSQAAAHPGVARIFTAADIPGINRVGIIANRKDQPILAEEAVRYAGDALALIAAESMETARAAARLIQVELEPLPALRDPRLALAPDAPQLGEGGNLLLQARINKGQAEEVIASAPVVVSNTYATSRATHAPIEPEGGRAFWADGVVVVQASTQNPHHDQSDVARLLGLPQDQVRVIQAETGGGFGGKLDLGLQGFLALAAHHLRRPVVMSYTREESLLATAKRHGVAMEYTTAADERGQLLAAKVDIFADSGVYASYGPAVAVRTAVHASGPYRLPHAQVLSRFVYTHNPWCGAMRGFGVPQVALAHEGQMDELARRLDLDPLDLRILNALRPGDQTATGQTLSRSAGLAQCLEALRPHYDRWRREAISDDCHLRGVGLGAMFYGIGNTAMSNPAGAHLQLDRKGRMWLCIGAADMGQGSDTVLSQIAAETLGWPAAQLRLVRADTARTLNAGASSASRQTFVSGNAVRLAAQSLLDLLLQEAARELDAPLEEVSLCPEGICAGGKEMDLAGLVRRMEARGLSAEAAANFDPQTTPLDPQTGQGSPYQTYAFAAQCALAQVDRDSGEVRVPKVAAAHDVGRAVNPRAVEGQIVGGVVMGLGYALMEEYEPGVTNFHQYHLPTMADAPQVIPIIIETDDPDGPYGAKGVGEPSLIPTAPAVAGGLAMALGRPLRQQPFSLERVMAALLEKEADEEGA